VIAGQNQGFQVYKSGCGGWYGAFQHDNRYEDMMYVNDDNDMMMIYEIN
jgi:hypothetical protein